VFNVKIRGIFFLLKFKNGLYLFTECSHQFFLEKLNNFWPQAPVYQACCYSSNTCPLTLLLHKLPQSVRTTASLCGFLMDFRVTGTGFSVSTSVFSWQYHSTNAPYSFIMYHWRSIILAITREINCPINNSNLFPLLLYLTQWDDKRKN